MLYLIYYLIKMLCPDLIISICEYLTDFNYYLLNKSLYKSIIMVEKGAYWKDKYNNFFKRLDKEYLILNGDYNWKQEYIGIMGFNCWSKIDNGGKLNLISLNLRKIPKEIGNLINLKYLQINDNQIEEIPKEIGNLINLRGLNLSYNKIKEIPKELGNLINLRFLYLSSNQIKLIPKELGNLINLKELHFYDNQIKEIPRKLGNLINLEMLYIKNNQIKNIPKEFEDLLINNNIPINFKLPDSS